VPQAHADEALVRHLLAEINKMPYVDSHVHLAPPFVPVKERPYTLVNLLNSMTYVAEFTYGADWPEVKSAIELNGHHAYYRPFLEAFRDFYGLGAKDELNDANVPGISQRMEAAHARGADFYKEVFERGKFAHIISLDGGDKGQADMPMPMWHSMWNIDGSFVYLEGRETVKGADGKKSATGPWNIDEMQEHFKVKLTGLKEMEALIQKETEAYFARGGVGLKSTTAYYRTLEFDQNVPQAQAEKLFAKVLKHQKLDEKGSKQLQDYLMCKVLDVLALHRWPIQFHTGNQQNWNMVANSNPLGLNSLFESGRFSNARIVVLHGGYPYTGEAITMVRYFKPTAYLDLAWMSLFSPAAAKESLSEAIDMLDGTQLMFGTDAANLEEMYGVSKFTRRILAEVLAEKIESGFLSEEPALRIARRILYTNAVELYGLDKLPKH
jgi:predicted TIM-barrel fold metal-dependent hydrolase